MATSTTEPAELILADAADLIEARGWDCTALPYAPGHTKEPYALGYTGALSVRGALEVASRDRDWENLDDGMCALASYVIDTVFVPMHSDRVYACPSCMQCREHQNRPLTLILNQDCANGCALCEEHVHLIDPHGYDQPPAEDIIDAWEAYMPHQRDVISGLRAAASRPAL